MNKLVNELKREVVAMSWKLTRMGRRADAMMWDVLVAIGDMMP